MAPSAEFLPRISSPEPIVPYKLERSTIPKLLRTSSTSLYLGNAVCIDLTIRDDGVISVVQNGC